MKNYKRLFKIGMTFTALGIGFMTMMMFVIMVYTGNSYDDVMKTAISRLLLRWPLWAILSAAFYIPGISGLVYANKLKRKAYEEAMRID